jgi:hypothetical protein
MSARPDRFNMIPRDLYRALHSIIQSKYVSRSISRAWELSYVEATLTGSSRPLPFTLSAAELVAMWGNGEKGESNYHKAFKWLKQTRVIIPASRATWLINADYRSWLSPDGKGSLLEPGQAETCDRARDYQIDARRRAGRKSNLSIDIGKSDLSNSTASDSQIRQPNPVEFDSQNPVKFDSQASPEAVEFDSPTLSNSTASDSQIRQPNPVKFESSDQFAPNRSGREERARESKREQERATPPTPRPRPAVPDGGGVVEKESHPHPPVGGEPDDVACQVPSDDTGTYEPPPLTIHHHDDEESDQPVGYGGPGPSTPEAKAMLKRIRCHNPAYAAWAIEMTYMYPLTWIEGAFVRFVMGQGGKSKGITYLSGALGRCRSEGCCDFAFDGSRPLVDNTPAAQAATGTGGGAPPRYKTRWERDQNWQAGITDDMV